MKNFHKYICLVFLAVFLTACKKDDVIQETDLHTNYFSFQEGRYIIYDALEIYHDDDSGIHDTIQFKLKTVIGQPYTDNSGRIGREFERYKSFDSGVSWQISDVWTAFLTGERAELIEENQRLIKLVFLPTSDKSWNINAFNSLNPQMAYYTDIHVPNSINSVSFDSTLRVIQSDYFTLVDYRKQTEVYAKSVGMIQKYSKDLVIENFDTLHPKKGKEIYYNLTAFGIQ